MENGLERVYNEIGRYRPVPWEQIPDLGLYMDQVITFITRIYEPLYGDTTKSYLSAPMINNYVKNKLIPRPTGKKYSRLQIAMLIMIVALKRVCMMEDIREMLAMRSDLSPAMDCAIFASAYRAGCECLLHGAPEEADAP